MHDTMLNNLTQGQLVAQDSNWGG